MKIFNSPKHSIHLRRLCLEEPLLSTILFHINNQSTKLGEIEAATIPVIKQMNCCIGLLPTIAFNFIRVLQPIFLKLLIAKICRCNQNFKRIHWESRLTTTKNLFSESYDYLTNHESTYLGGRSYQVSWISSELMGYLPETVVEWKQVKTYYQTICCYRFHNNYKKTRTAQTNVKSTNWITFKTYIIESFV